MNRKLTGLLLSSAMMVLSACGGASDVASPGEGTLVTPPPTTTPTPAPGTGGTGGTGGTAAATCPTGTIDRGTITNAQSSTTWRTCELSGRINADYTVQKLPGVIYSLAGPVNVGTDIGGDGALASGQPATLTVQAGVVIYASSGNDYLVINRGSRIFAQGTASAPIIFTARDNVLGTATESSQGLWGGVILLGRAPISDCNTNVTPGTAQCQNVIEGTTSSLYGGALPNDNSGTMQYVQIRYSGFAIAPGNELQGLTTGGVGSATTLDHIQTFNSSDDGLEFFGGRQNLKYFVSMGTDDDALDTDLGYRGTIQFVLAIQRDATNGDSMIESDSNGNEDALPRQYTRVSNATFIQRSTVQGLNTLLFRGGTDYAVLNSIVTGPTTGVCLDIDETAGTTTRATNAALQDVGPPAFRSVVFTCATSFRGDDSNVPVGTLQSIFGAGANNNQINFNSSLLSVFVNGANENAVSATDPLPFNADPYVTVNTSAPNQLTAVNYIGAVRSTTDTWYAPWACSASYAQLATALCTAIPTT